MTFLVSFQIHLLQSLIGGSLFAFVVSVGGIIISKVDPVDPWGEKFFSKLGGWSAIIMVLSAFLFIIVLPWR